MTYDELLAKIDDDASYQTLIFVLRAVVERHKEVKFITGQSSDHTFELSQQVCKGCTALTGLPIPYPCYDIQAIEKELK